MQYYSQKSYPKVKLGKCLDSISQSGCFLTSFCNLLGEMKIATIDPPTFNKKAFPNGGCLADATKWANLFTLDYQKTTKKPNQVCIIETNYWKSVGVPQHFCLWRTDGMIIDPLDVAPVWKKNTKYPIVSYRIFTPKIAPETLKTPQIQQSKKVCDICGKLY